MTDHIISREIGNLGYITLNRPEALNALTQEMCEDITRLLIMWESDPNIGAVLLDGAGGRAFCAGGDVVMLYDSGKAGDTRAEKFWRTEYALNEYIQRYPKPYIAMIDGFVMGGGVGLSMHGDIRIAGDNTLFAMPETGIGYFPDVGGTYFLPRLGNDIGNWLGLTGARAKTAMTCRLGIATHYVPSEAHEDLIKALGNAALDGSRDAVDAILLRRTKGAPHCDAPPEALAAFSRASVADVLQALDKDGGEWAAKQASILRSKSPLACCVTFEALKRGGDMSFREAMTQELDLSLNILKTQDFFEGIRAQLIDKDRNPKWSHDDAGVVQASQIERLFKSTADPKQEFLS